MEVRPQVLIIAGPNGAGKSTCAARFIPRAVPFVNADNIARELEPAPGRSAGITAGAFSWRGWTSWSGAATVLRWKRTWRTAHWRRASRAGVTPGITSRCFSSGFPAPAWRRVAQRVRSGGHDIPEATIRRRYRVGLRLLFEIYQPLVDAWRLYDNSGTAGPLLIAHSVRADQDSDRKRVRVKQRQIWERLQREVGDE